MSCYSLVQLFELFIWNWSHLWAVMKPCWPSADSFFDGVCHWSACLIMPNASRLQLCRSSESLDLRAQNGSSLPTCLYGGGWWERSMRSIKSSLKKSVCRKSLIRTELKTALLEIEGMLNSRPLTFVADDAVRPLTPSHFLVGRAMFSKADMSPEVPDINSDDLRLPLNYRNELLEK